MRAEMQSEALYKEKQNLRKWKNHVNQEIIQSLEGP